MRTTAQKMPHRKHKNNGKSIDYPLSLNNLVMRSQCGPARRRTNPSAAVHSFCALNPLLRQMHALVVEIV
jgi:hypothetical protein